jgi:hypothetical protein
VNFLEFYRFRYTIVARLTKPIKHHLPGLKYRRISSELAVSAFHYQPYGWKKRRRFVLIRRRLPDKPDQQLSLLKVGKYIYQVQEWNNYIETDKLTLNFCNYSTIQQEILQNY